MEYTEKRNGEKECKTGEEKNREGRTDEGHARLHAQRAELNWAYRPDKEEQRVSITPSFAEGYISPPPLFPSPSVHPSILFPLSSSVCRVG